MKPSLDPLRDSQFTELLTHLHHQVSPSPSRDFTDGVMARLHQRRFIPRKRLPAAWMSAAAAAIIIFSSMSWIYYGAHKSSSPIAFLMATQRSDGSWSVNEGPLRSRYDTSVTALALLALMRADPAALEGPQGVAIQAGMAHLLRQQSLDGRFEIHSSSIQFTPYLAGMALQTAAQLPHAQPAWRLAAAQTASHLPSGVQMVKLNRYLAHPDSFPPRWADAGGAVTVAAIQLLRKSSTPI